MGGGESKSQRKRRRYTNGGFHTHKNSNKDLPVTKVLHTIYEKLMKDRVVVVIGETGSGKTTQIPVYLHEKGLTTGGIIGVTQPRRIAAISVSNWVSKEKGIRLGDEIGYSVRFDDVTSPKTKIKYMTDGILLRELILDNKLKAYSCLILDEVHERSCRTDVLLGVVKGLLMERSDFRIIIMSATLDTQKFTSYMNNCEVITIPGRLYPVSIFSPTTQLEDYLDAALVTVFQIHVDMPMGDILVFLTGQEEIENLKRIIEENAKTLPPTLPNLYVVTIYASMPLERQARVFAAAPKNTRKVILTTNISETSVTIPMIKYVIDSGVAKFRDYDQKTGLETLSIRPISKFSSKQRAGRAGRDGPGSCYRLYTNDAFENLPDFTEPEILRTDISSVLLTLKAMGVDDIISFDFIDCPSRSAIVSSLEKLYLLGALDQNGNISDIGRKMAIFPTTPENTKSIIVSSTRGCLEQVISIISMLSVEPVFWIPSNKREEAAAARRRFYGSDSDHILLLNLLNAYIEVNHDPKWCTDNFLNASSMKMALKIKEQLMQLCNSAKLKTSTPDKSPEVHQILASIISGFFRKISSKQQSFGLYTNIFSRKPMYIHPTSSLFDQKPELVVYNEIVTTSKSYMRNCSKISPDQLKEVLPECYKTKPLVFATT